MNSYLESDREALGRRCGELAHALGERKSRSSEERAALAEDIRLLLIALQQRLDVGMFRPGAPADRMRRDERVSVSDAYSEALSSRMKALRWDLLEEAAELVLGDRSSGWLRDESRDATDSDSGFRAALQRLDGLRENRRR